MKRTLLSLFSVLALAFASNAAVQPIISVKTTDPTKNLEKAESFKITIEMEGTSGLGWFSAEINNEKAPFVTNGTETFDGTFTRTMPLDAGTFVISFNPAITEPGTYTLVLPEGLYKVGFGNSEDTNAEYEFPNFFTIAGGDEPEPVVKNYFEDAFIGMPEPDYSLEDYDNVLSGVGIVLPNFPLEDVDDADVVVDYSMVTIDGTSVSRYEDEDGEAIPSIYALMDNVYLMIPFEPYTTPGKFTFAIAPEAITINGVKNPSAFTAEYTIEGPVGAYVIVNDAENNVVDLAGRVVLRSADAAAVNSLEPGIYVINGKKIVIRK